MPTQPRIVERPDQPYVAISGLVTMQTIGAIADRLPDVFLWPAEHDLDPAGAPFFKYNLIDMQRQLEVEVGVPLATPAQGDGDVHAGVLPAGQAASLRRDQPARAARTRSRSSSSPMAAASPGRNRIVPVLVLSSGWRAAKPPSRPSCQP